MTRGAREEMLNRQGAEERQVKIRSLAFFGGLAVPILVLPTLVSAEPVPAPRTAQERSVATESKAGPAPQLVAPESLENRLFLSGRPLGRMDLRKRSEAAELERMLKDREKLVVLRRQQAIKQLDAFIAREPEASEYMADALLRLAELRWEQARADYLEVFEAWQKLPPDKRAGDAPVPDLGVALELYDRILTKHKSFDRYDLVLYMKAYALIEAGRTREALFEYKRIIDEFPNSRFMPDAHMAFAEWHFGGAFDYGHALTEYETVLQFPESELSDLALFKSAWCLWKLGRTKDAATRFRQVLDLGGKLQGISAERRRRLLELQDEALEYLIQVFTEDESNTAADLHGFLSQIGGEKYATKVLRRLSRAFFDQARYERATQAYSMLLESEPHAPQAPEYQSQIAAAYSALDDAKGTVQALEQLARGYNAKSAWAQRQGDPEDIKRASAMAERQVRKQALKYHARGQKEKLDKDFQNAVALYQLHVTEFPDSPHAYEINFYLAEIQFHRVKDYTGAGKAYLRAARLQPKGELTHDALYNAIIAFETARVAELQACKPSEASAQLPPECQETDTDRSFSEAVAFYIELYPNDPEVAGILFRQGRMYFERKIYDPAVRQFGQILQSYPKSEFAAAAGELVLESFNRAHDYQNIETWARKLKNAPAFQNAEAQAKLDALILQSVFKIGEDLAEQKKHAEAGNAYMRAAHEFPRDPRAPQAYYNAGQQWQQAGKIELAGRAFDELIDRHPGSKEGALGAWTAAQMFESIAQFRDAAEHYELYANRFEQGEKRSDALYNAVVLRLAAGDHERVVEDGKRFGQLFPKHESADEVLFMVGRAHEDAERWKAAADLYAQYSKRGRDLDRRVEAGTRLALVLQKSGDPRGAERALKDVSAAAHRSAAQLNAGRYYAAQARFMQGDMVLAEFEKIQIGGERNTLEKRLQQKSELLRKAASIYGEVAELRVAEWVTAALYKIGQSYELFAEALREAPIPSGLSEEQEAAYRDQLAMFVVPIEERALEAYEGGYHKALELRVFNRWTQKLREGLTRLNAVQYPPLREIGGGLTGDEVLAAPEPYTTLQRTAPGSAAGTQPAAAANGKKAAAKKKKNKPIRGARR
jgi:cellulose synthase operon protein C